MQVKENLIEYVPQSIGEINNLQTGIPELAKDPIKISAIEEAVSKIPTKHQLFLADSRQASFLSNNSIQLIVTSPPYWTLKQYRDTPGQLGDIQEYASFVEELEKVWRICFDKLVPGGRLVCVVGDVCLSRRKNNGEHVVMPLHASIQEQCRSIGFSNLAPIIWHKISNAQYEVEKGSSFLGKPYEPNGIIKNDIEYILMERKPGGYRQPSKSSRILSVISEQNHRIWFQQIWFNLNGVSTKQHPAPYPIQLAERLIRMFSFVGDTILDPFMGSGTTNIAAANWGRNSIGIEIDPHYFSLAHTRMRNETDLFSTTEIETYTG